MTREVLLTENDLLLMDLHGFGCPARFGLGDCDDRQVCHEYHSDRGTYDTERCEVCITAAENQTMDVAS